MNHLRSSVTIFNADQKHRELISALTSHIGWSACSQGEEGIERQAGLLNEFIKNDSVSGVILLIDEQDGEVMHSATFGAAFRKKQALNPASSESQKAARILEKMKQEEAA